jgi:hypothetical protein
MHRRATQRITSRDLKRLSDIARADRKSFFKRYPRYAAYEGRVACVALCQGAALHFIDGRNGISDFDVWTFYYGLPPVRFPPRRHARAEYGPSHFTNWSGRVDLMGRSLPYPSKTDPAKMLRSHLSDQPTRSAYFLAKKAVVLIDPPSRRGRDRLAGTCYLKQSKTAETYAAEQRSRFLSNSRALRLSKPAAPA